MAFVLNCDLNIPVCSQLEKMDVLDKGEDTGVESVFTSALGRDRIKINGSSVDKGKGNDGTVCLGGRDRKTIGVVVHDRKGH